MINKRKIDLTGQKINKLLIIKFFGNSKSGDRLWQCKCDCGNEKITCTSSLLNNNTKSCGNKLKVIEYIGQTKNNGLTKNLKIGLK